MRKPYPFRSRFVLLVIALTSGLGSPSWIARAQTPAPAEWTLMYYMDANNDLEAHQLENLKQMLAVGGSADVHLVALVARSPKSTPEGQYTNEGIANLPNWETAKLLHVEKNSLTELADWGAVNMGDGATLQRFVTAAVRAYPAKRYALLFADHGSSWPGCCTDEATGDDLTLPKITGALDATKGAFGQLELVGFDACLMGNLEVAYALSPYAHYMVGSEELEPGEGWSYTPVMAALTGKPTMDGAELGKTILSGFNDFYMNSTDPSIQNEGMGVTLSLLDLTKVEALKSAVNGVADQVRTLQTNQGRDAWLKLARARAGAEEFGKSGTSTTGEAVHDLEHLLTLFKANVTDAGATAAATATEAALQQVVVANVHGSARPNANGLTLFFPPDSAKLTGQTPTVYSDTAFAQNGKWLGFLTDYTALADANPMPPQIEPIQPSGSMLGTGTTRSIKLHSGVTGPDVEETDFILTQQVAGATLIIGRMKVNPGSDGSLDEAWDGQWFTLETKDRKLIAPIDSFEPIPGKPNVYDAEVPVQVNEAGGNGWVDATLYWLLDLGGNSVKGTLIYAFADEAEGPREIRFRPGDQIRPVFDRIDPMGNEVPVPPSAKDPVLMVNQTQDLTVGYDDVPPGTYAAGFEVTDYEGKTTDTVADVTICASGGCTATSVVPGDIDGNGKVNVQDATLGLQITVGLVVPTAAQVKAGDLNGNGKIDITDVVHILKIAVGLISG